MSSSAENLNNAIATIGPLTGHSPPAVRRAVADLESHWARFWQSNTRHTLPEPALQPRYQRYVEWYTRAWLLLPEAERKDAVSPADLDVSWTALATDTLKQHADSIVHVQQSAVDLTRDISRAAGKVADYSKWLIGAGLIGLVLWKFPKMRRGLRGGR